MQLQVVHWHEYVESLQLHMLHVAAWTQPAFRETRVIDPTFHRADQGHATPSARTTASVRLRSDRQPHNNS